MKLAVIGGGGVRSMFLAKSIAQRADELNIEKLVFMDNDEEKLAVFGGMAGKVCSLLAPKLKFSTTTNAVEALIGADYVINGRNENAVARIKVLTGGQGPDIVFETAGSKFTIAQTAHIARRGGRIVLVGMSAEEELTFNFGQVMAKELEIRSLFRYVNMFPKSVATVASGLAPIEKVATHVYSLDQIQQAFEDSVNKKNEVVKAVIKFD